MAEHEFRLPDLGEGLEDAEVVRWLVAEGDSVELNQPLIEVDTAKALVEIPSPVAGKVKTLHASAGDTVKVGAALVTFEVEGEQSQRQAVLVGYGVDEAGARRRRRLTAPASAPAKSEIIAAPPVRRLAAEMGVDLSKVTGTGPNGRITREDVAAAAATEEGPSERVPVKGVRKLVAEKMARSASEIPHVTTYLTFDATEVLKKREELASSGVKITALSVIARAFVEICKQHPKLNASWDGSSGEITVKRYYRLGVATDTDRGLIVPVIFDADKKSTPEIASEIARLSGAARDGTAQPSELIGSTVTISNVGSFGAEYGTPIVNHPESSILAVGVIEDRAVVRDGDVVVRPMCTLSLSFDHRILDGAEAGRALADLRTLLENSDGITD